MNDLLKTSTLSDADLDALVAGMVDLGITPEELERACDQNPTKPRSEPMPRSVRIGESLMWAVTALLLLFACIVFLTGCEPLEPGPGKTPPKTEPEPPPATDPTHGNYDDPVKQELWRLHALRRNTEGVPRLAPHAYLDGAAQGHADWMAANDKMSHTGAGGSSFWDRVKRAGYQGRGGGENIAAGYRSPEAVINGWWNSAGHKRNMLNPNWDHVGFGYAKSKRTGRIYWCTVFAYGDDRTGVKALPRPAREELPPPLEAMLPEEGQITSEVSGSPPRTIQFFPTRVRVYDNLKDMPKEDRDAIQRIEAAQRAKQANPDTSTDADEAGPARAE